MKKTTRFLLAVALIFLQVDDTTAQITQTQIGVTTYDLQTNASVQDRIVNHGNGTLSAVWTYSESFDIAASDRGTGYNYYNGSTWLASPSSRIEGAKTGWPNIATTSGGKEVFVCHNIVSGFVTQGTRNSIGSGSWTLTDVSTTAQVWTRMAIGGSNGQTIHHISLYDPIPVGNPWTNGVQSQLLYWRSQDGGITYDIQEAVIPGLDQTNYSAFSGDAYHIAAQGNTVVIVYFGALTRTIMAKSTDNGQTWTTTTLIDAFPSGVSYDPGSNNTTGSVIGISDINSDGIADTVAGTDGGGWVLLDGNGIAHVFFGNMQYIDDTPGDDQWSYFPGTNGLMYWNESFGTAPPITIGAALDIDGNGVLDILTDLPIYNGGLSGYPSAGIAGDGCIYVSYSAIVENNDQGAQNYRHIYITRSCDNGCTWSDAVDVTPGSFTENVYASMAHLVDVNVHIVFQQDFEPGIAVNGDEDAYVTNNIIYLKVPTTTFNALPAAACYTNISGDSMYCSGDSVLLTASCGSAWLWSTGETTQSIYYNGVWGTVTVDITTDCGTIQHSKVLSGPTTAPVINVTSTLSDMCPGDTAQLTVTSDAGGTILWSTSDVTPTISVTSAGTYSVTVTNCGGVSSTSYTITAPSAPAAALTSSTSSMCNGDTATLWVSPVTQGSYAWSTGATTTSISVTTVGTYSVTVTNCAGSDIASTTISLPAPPVASVSGNTAFCNGGSITLTAGSQPSATYLWSTGETTQSINVTTETTVTLTVTNCGGTDNTSITTAFFAPPTVVVTTSGSPTFCADGGFTTFSLSGFAFGASPYTYLWSNGNPSQTLVLSMASESGTYYVTATDACGISVNSDTTQVLIGEIQVTTVSTDAACGGIDGTGTALPNLGTAPYSYFWNDPSSQTNQTATGLSAGTYSVTVIDAIGCTISAGITVGSTAAPSVTSFGTNPSTCGASDGSAIAISSGGTPAYTYLWSSGSTSSSATNLGAGLYSVTVTDANGCEDSSFVSIASSSAPSLFTSTTNASCIASDGTATVSVTGGITPYTYIWNDPNSQTNATATGLATGTYTIIVIDAAGCLNTTTATVGSFSPPIASATGFDPTSCGSTDGFALGNATGGTTPYTYLWSNSATTASISLLSAGVYSLTITDANGCMDSTTVSLNSPGAPSIFLNATNASCLGNDGTATVTPSGGTPPYTYSWDDPFAQSTPTATGLAGGTYNVAVTDNFGCTATGQIAITAGGTLSVTASSTNPTSCSTNDGTASAAASGGSLPYTYLWDDPGTQTTQTAIGLSDGVYNVTVTDATGCSGSSLAAVTSPSAPSIFATGINPSSCSTSDGVVTSSVTGGTNPLTYAWSSGGTGANETNLGAGFYTVTVTDVNGCTDTASVNLTSPGAPVLSTNTSDANCAGNDGVASVFASGGVTPYTYLWDDPNNQVSSIATGLASGNYNVTVTDNAGCMAFINAIVGSAGVGPILAFTTTDAACYGASDGSAAVSASGGATPYSYSWSHGPTGSIVTNLQSGTYIIIVSDNNGCSTTDSVTISEPIQITASYTTVDPSCGNSDGIASLLPSGGTAPYTYQWDSSTGNQTGQSAGGLSAGTFSVTVSDGIGCSEVISVGLSNAGAASVTLVGSDVTCNGGNNGSVSSAIAGGTLPLVYSWSNGSSSSNINSLSAGTYTLTVTDALNCLTIESMVITEPTVIVLATSDIIVSSGSACDGQATATVSGGMPPYTYQWDDPASQVTSTAVGLCVSMVNVIVSDANGCTKFGSVTIDSVAVGIEVLRAGLDLAVFPNPSSGVFTVQLSDQNIEVHYIEVVDIIGQQVYFEAVHAPIVSYELEMKNQVDGVFFLIVSTDKGNFAKKIVVQ